MGDMAALSSGPLTSHCFMLQLTLWGAGQAGVSPHHCPCPGPPAHAIAEPPWAAISPSQQQRVTLSLIHI